MDRRHFLASGLTAAAVLAAAPRSFAQDAAASFPRINAHAHLQALDWFRANVFAPPPRGERKRRSPALASGGSGNARSLAEAAEARAGQRRYGPTLEDQTARLLDEMDAAGIDIAFLLAMDFDYTGEKLRVPYERQLELLAQTRDRHPGRFLLFAGVDPRRGPAGVELYRRAVKDLGVVGMGEFAPHFFGFAPNDRERCYPIYEACAELDTPIVTNASIVASHVSRWCDPLYFEDVAHDFSTLNILLSSAGVPHWTESALALAQSKANVFIEIGDWQARTTSDPVETVLRYVRRALDTGARGRILFGSDFPVFARAVSEKDWVETFTSKASERGVAFSAEELRLFFSDNAQEFLDRDLVAPARGKG